MLHTDSEITSPHCRQELFPLSLLSLLMSCGVIYDLSLMSLSRILNLSKIRLWTVEILAVHTSSLCACTLIVMVAIINELRSYF